MNCGRRCEADFRNQYSTVNALMRLQELLIAESIEAVEGGPAGERLNSCAA